MQQAPLAEQTTGISFSLLQPSFSGMKTVPCYLLRLVCPPTPKKDTLFSRWHNTSLSKLRWHCGTNFSFRKSTEDIYSTPSPCQKAQWSRSQNCNRFCRPMWAIIAARFSRAFYTVTVKQTNCSSLMSASSMTNNFYSLHRLAG